MGFHLPKSLHASLLVLSLAGCSVGPRYKAPQPAPAQFHSAEAQLTTTTPFDERWWKQFEDPVLDDLMEKALVANNDILIARARLVEARSVYDERKFDRYPIVPADVSYSYAKQQIPGFFNDRYTVNTFRAGLDAAWEVDLFGRVRHEHEEDEESGCAEDNKRGSSVLLLLKGEVRPLEPDSLRENLMGKRLHAKQRGTRGDTRSRYPLHLRGWKKIVARYTIRDRIVLQLCHRSDRYHFTGGVAYFQSHDVRLVASVLTIGLDDHFVRPAQ